MISISANKRAPSDRGIFSPLRYAVFRRIWTASLLSNFGLLILGVGAAWAMTKLTSSASMVALVQTSLMLPVALVSTPAGAIADMFDRRIVGLVALSIALAGSISLSALAWLGVMTPALLLVSCFTIGSGMALFGPAWAGVCQRTSAGRGAALGCRTQWHQLQHCPQLWARDWGRHSRLSGGRRRIHYERASLSAPPDRLVLLASSEGAVAVAAGKTGASGRFGSSLHRPLAANSNCPWADLGYRNCRRFSLSAHADRRARPVARRRSNIRRYAGGVWNGRR